MFVDYVMNNQGFGEVGQILAGVRFDPGLLRPYLKWQDGRNIPCVTINTGRLRQNEKSGQLEPVLAEYTCAALNARGIHSPVFNATTLRKEEWIQLDRKVLLSARQRLMAWKDLVKSSSVGGFNAMSKTTYEYEAQSDVGQAIVSMDGLTDDRADTPLYKLRSIPLPITHAGFEYSSRQLAVSRNSGTPLDTTTGEMCGRRVAETVEQTTLGTLAGLAYGYQSTGVTAHDSTYGSQIYGYRNFPGRNTKTNMTVPTGTNPNSTLADVLSMRSTQYDDRFYGPYRIYHSVDWDQWLDNDYYVTSTGAPYQTLRDRLEAIDGIEGVKRSDFLTSTYNMLMVQMTSDVAQAINGMDITTVQWESQGGMKLNFKVMAIQVPLLRADYSDRCGIMDGRTA